MHKKIVLTAHQIMSKDTVKPRCINNASGACSAIGRLSGKCLITKFRADSTGLNYGLPKATVSGSYALCLIIAYLRSGASKITGLTKRLKNALDIKSSNTLSMMQRIFIRMAVC